VAFCACLGPIDNLVDSLGGGAHYMPICMPSLKHVPMLATCFAFAFVFLFVSSYLWWLDSYYVDVRRLEFG
jgi:hypothetical protein